jgi:hypothetical protein
VITSAWFGVTYLTQSGRIVRGQWDLIPDRSFEGKRSPVILAQLEGEGMLSKKECLPLPARKPPEGQKLILAFLPEHG